MSHFLERLGERAVGLSAVAQPLLRQVYAESPQPVIASEMGALDAGPLAASGTRPAYDPAARRKSVTNQPEPDPGSALTPDEHAISGARRQQRRDPDGARTGDQEPNERTSTARAIRPSGEARNVPPRPTLADVMAHLYPAEEQVAPGAPAVTVARSSSIDRRLAQPPRSASTSPGPVSPPQLFPQPERTHSQDRERQHEPAGASDVHVSIGKIVLHPASPAPTPSPAPRTAERTLSLDAYLARRRGEHV